MSIKTFFQLLRRYFLLIVLSGVLAAGAAYWFVSQQKPDFTSEALVSTGIISSVSIKNTGGGKSADRDYAQNELDNLVSLATAHKTREDLAARLLARYLVLPAPDPRWVAAHEFEELHQKVFTPELLALRGESFESTLANVIRERDKTERNAVQALIYAEKGYFAIDNFTKNLKVYRRGNSDLLQFSYTTTDAAICKQTLNELLAIFMEKHKYLKENQSSEVSSFFAEATTKSAERLKDAEARMLQFRVQNNIINYDEQTRTIAIRKEDLDDLKFKEDMNLQGVTATRSRVENELGNRSALNQINEGMLTLKQELNQVSGQLAKMNIAPDAAANIARKQAMEAREQEIKQQMARFVQRAYNYEQSPSGIQTATLLDEWLNTIIVEEQAEARLTVIGQRQQEFADIYSQYAPWGSQLTELQREIGLAENEYLENLHSYNQALLHQQHTLMSSNLELIDKPFLPVEKPDFKRFLLVILAFIGGSGSVLVGLIALAFVDDTLKDADIVHEKTGLTVAAITPNLAVGPQTGHKYFVKAAARDQALALLLQQMKVETLQKDAQPRLIVVASTRREEGKSWIAAQMADLLRQEDNKVLFLYPVEGGKLPAMQPQRDNIGYELSNRMLDAERIEDLDVFGHRETDLEEYHYVIMEIPALLSGKYPLPMLRQFDMGLLVCRSNRNWEAADQQALHTLQRATRCPVQVVLNGAEMPVLKTFMGELSGSFLTPVVARSSKEKPYQYDA